MAPTANTLVLSGVILAIIGVVGLAIPVFTTAQTKDVAVIGDLKMQTQEDTAHTIPPLVSGSALVLGVTLVAGGFYRRA